MNFEKAKFEIGLQKDIREEKEYIANPVKKETQGLINTGFNRLKELRNTEDGKKNELAITNLANELELDPKDTEKAFDQGLRFNIKAGHKTGLIDKESSDDDIDMIIGAYVLSFRSALNWFKKDKNKGKDNTPKTILEIAKKMYLLSPKIIHELREEYKDNLNVSDGMIKRFVIASPKNRQRLIKKALKQIHDLKKENPDVSDGTIKHFVVRNFKDPQRAIKKDLEQTPNLEVLLSEITKIKIKIQDKNKKEKFITFNSAKDLKAIKKGLMVGNIAKRTLSHYYRNKGRQEFQNIIQTRFIQNIKNLSIKAEDWKKAVFQSPSSFYQSPATINANIEGAANRLDITKEEYIEAALKKPQLFHQSPATINTNIEGAADRLGVTKERYTKTALKEPSLFTYSPETIQNKVILYNKLVKQSRDDILNKVLKSPTLLGFAPERLLGHYMLYKMQGNSMDTLSVIWKNPIAHAQKKLSTPEFKKFEKAYKYLYELSKRRRDIKRKAGGIEAETRAYKKHTEIIEKYFGKKAEALNQKGFKKIDDFLDSVIRHVEKIENNIKK